MTAAESTAHPDREGVGLRTWAVQTERLKVCPQCGGADLEDWAWAHDRLHATTLQRFQYSRCATCTLIFLALRPVEAEMAAFYTDGYGPYHTPTEASARPRAGRLKSLQRRVARWTHAAWPDGSLARLEAFYTPPRPEAAVLDFGCGSGQFLDTARARGWSRTIGVDTPQVAARLRASTHEVYVAGPHVWEAFADGSLDVVRLFHSLEHLYRPREALVEAYRVLRRGGRLHLGLPNPEGLSARLFGARWWGLECPRHLMLFPKQLIVEVLSALGFEAVEVIDQPSSKDLLRSLGFLLVDLGCLEPKAITVLASPALPLAWTATLGIADRFHVLARKP